MSLDDIRDAARAVIHGEFALPATIRNADESSEIMTEVPIRFHRDARRPFGDLDREGFALVIDTYNIVIIDRTNWPIPLRKYVLDFGRNRKVRLENELTEQHERYSKWEVSNV